MSQAPFAAGEPASPRRGIAKAAAGRRTKIGNGGTSCAALCVVGLAFLLRAQGLSYQSLWRDEVDSLRFSVQPLVSLLRAFVEPGQNGPLYYLGLRGWQEIAGRTEFSLRFPSTLAGALAVPLVYRLGRRLAPNSPGVAVTASLLAAVSPYLVWYSQEARVYAVLVSLVLGSMACLLSAIQGGGWTPWLGYVLLTSMAFYSHVSAVLMVPVHWATLIVFGHRRALQLMGRYLTVLIVLALLYLPLAAWQLPRLTNPVEGGYAFVPLPQMLGSLAITYASGVLAGGAPWSLVGLSALIVAAFGRSDRDHLRRAGLLATWALLPVLAFFVLTLRQPMYTARYLIFVVPGLLLLASYGWRALASRSPWLSVLPVALILVSSLVSVGRQMATPIKADMRSAAALVDSRWNPGDRIIFQIPYARHTFQYYIESSRPTHRPDLDVGGDRLFLPHVAGSRPTWWVEGLYTNAGMPPAEVDSAMTRLLAGSRVVWLVASEEELWDERLLVRGWLFEHAEITLRGTFVGVTVYRCELW